ncbi:MAG: oligosaccharide flippase family protein [Chloroflexota bacterium]
MSTRETIAKNASVMLVTQGITWSLTLLLTVFMPRYLGDAAIGQFHTATSLWAIAAILMGFGMDRLMTKEIARDTTKAASMLSASIVLRLALSALAFGGMALFVWLFDYPQDTRQVVFVIGLATVVWQLIAAVEAAVQGLEQMQISAAGSIAGKVVNVGVSIALLLMGYGVLVIAAVTAAAALVNLAVQLFLLRRRLPLRLRPQRGAALPMLKGGLPYLASGLFLQIYMQFDIVILSLLTDERVVGWYGAADVLFGTLLFVPTVFINAVFPALSRMYAQASDSLSRVARKSFDLLLVLSLPIGLGMVAVSNQAVVLLYGQQFANSGPVLALFGIVLIFTYLNMLLGRYLISMDRQNQWTAVMAVAAVATLPLDLLLIPYCDRVFGNGGLGGGVSFIITELGMTIAGLRLLPRGTLDGSNTRTALKALIAGLAMAAVAWGLREMFIVIPVLAGVVVYGALVLALGVLSEKDRQMLSGTVRQMLRKVRRSPAPAASD